MKMAVPHPERSARQVALDASVARHRAETVRRIEAAALLLFERHRLEAVTVDQIAEASGISRRTFYRYFDSPGGVVASVPRRLMERWGAQLRTSPPDEPILTSLLLASRRSPPSEAEVASLAAAFAVMRRSPEAWARASGEYLLFCRQQFEAFIAERMQAKGQDPRPASVIAAGLAAMIAHIAEASAPDEGRFDADRLAAALRDFGEMVLSADLMGAPLAAPATTGAAEPAVSTITNIEENQ